MRLAHIALSENQQAMNLLNFFRLFPDEQACRDHWRVLREQQGVNCKKCKGTDHYWLNGKQQFECKKCKFRTTLRSGTVMESSNLPFQYWYIAMHLMTSTKKSFSALELKKQIGHKRYEPVWALMHKLRASMGKRDSRYMLDQFVELDEGFFETTDKPKPDEMTRKRAKLKRGRGSQWQAKVLVMASTSFETKARGKANGHHPQSRLKYLKMVVMEDLKKGSIESEVSQSVKPEAIAITDGNRSYTGIKALLKYHIREKVPGIKADKALPWVHIAIANAKRLLLGIFHSIKRAYLQNYLNEFCYKLNRRYFGERLFDRLMVASVATPWY